MNGSVFFKGQVYEWGRFWNTGSHTRTKFILVTTPPPPPPPPHHGILAAAVWLCPEHTGEETFNKLTEYKRESIFLKTLTMCVHTDSLARIGYLVSFLDKMQNDSYNPLFNYYCYIDCIDQCLRPYYDTNALKATRNVTRPNKWFRRLKSICRPVSQTQ